ncbi:hypothetical protein ACIFOT_02960 [Neobacillus sp. NRS-1170]
MAVGTEQCSGVTAAEGGFMAMEAVFLYISIAPYQLLDSKLK